ncbi:unnamed protein product [Clonostachys rosea f. rosea IK726]|uniref:Uncharacterized protein n=1 Tax=Clonostachys rosea f. rosea IK726 TaxID=1349383 RepID=A0ACA9UTB5_BIOOC|nr:unnamed protein product [Clonostachys rosea f. rosea IK726]
MAEHGNILGSLDAEHLQNIGHLRTNPNGTMKLHRRQLNRSSDEANSHIPLNITVDSPHSPPDAFSIIPQRLISPATLEYLGFSSEMSMERWNTWIAFKQPTDSDGDGPFDSRGDYADDGDDEQWRLTMDKLGLSTDFQDRIMHPTFTDIRLTQSCAYWCKDTVEMRYEALFLIQQSSLDRQRLLKDVRGHSYSSSSSSQQRQAVGHTPFIGPLLPAAHSEKEQQPESTSQAPVSIFGHAPSINDIATNGIDGHTILFKGIDEARTYTFLDAQGCIQDIATILSSTPSDFSSDRALFYFTPELETARYYAGYAKIRSSEDTNVVIICIAIPNEAIQSLTGDSLQYLYWPSEDWKEYVRYNRTRKPMPFELRRFRRATLLIGSTAKKANQAWRQLTGSSSVTEDYVLKINGEPAVQYVFDGSQQGQDFLMESIVPRPYMYQFTKSDFDAWFDEHRGQSG